ncbi:ATP-binding cassette domain-containing protein, partial [Janibacter melonis]|uniref:ATP-binding cassette domain-containing protein n=1 Tax=Janibacter melonis TaxID=262209 RepID=UPI0031D8F677
DDIPSLVDLAAPGHHQTVRLSAVRALSGGERTRLAIARALLSERPVLLLDEPGAHLDHPTARAVLADLMSAAAGRTVVLVSHHGTGVDLAGWVVELDRPTTREKVAAHA